MTEHIIPAVVLIGHTAIAVTATAVRVQRAQTNTLPSNHWIEGAETPYMA